VKTAGLATASVQCSAPPRTPHNAHIGHHSAAEGVTAAVAIGG
jgi:hypothetical protein